ncbi:cupin domain-containing protein [Actinomadura macrotermitis]|uniref:Cupin type-2 domain-containing protein n=1 Tax=Actinomadura macrotermitis TaxID=2585200 RepID=A0A7K0BYH0_9ACTN|nr:cupin domain-containing protein [Actinomadura macrotermitis]MQY06230.1 hypothetical protein [Actinomadura macrotermitis]
MPVIRDTDRRRTETPNGVMTTVASPTQGGTAALAVWHVDMHPGATGPRHLFDAEQVWTFLTGAASVELGGETLTAGPGDTLLLPADVERQITAGPDGFTAVAACPAGALVYNPPGVAGEPCDIAPKHDERIIAPWTR